MAESDLLEIAGVTSGRMCVNSEWGCLGDDGALDNVLTPYDHRVDQESSNPGERRCAARKGSWGSPWARCALPSCCPKGLRAVLGEGPTPCRT